MPQKYLYSCQNQKKKLNNCYCIIRIILLNNYFITFSNTNKTNPNNYFTKLSILFSPKCTKIHTNSYFCKEVTKFTKQ